MSRSWNGGNGFQDGAEPLCIAIGDVRMTCFPWCTPSKPLFLPGPAQCSCTSFYDSSATQKVNTFCGSTASDEVLCCPQVITISGRTIQRQAQASPNFAEAAATRIDELLAALPQNLVARAKDIRAKRTA